MLVRARVSVIDAKSTNNLLAINNKKKVFNHLKTEFLQKSKKLKLSQFKKIYLQAII